MKKLLLALVLALGAMPLFAGAEEAKLCPADHGGPDAGCVTVTVDSEAGTADIDADGSTSNPDPLDGYVHVKADGSGVSCSAEDEGSYNVAREGETEPSNQACQDAAP